LEMNSELNRPFRAQFFLTRIYRKRGHFIVIFQVIKIQKTVQLGAKYKRVETIFPNFEPSQNWKSRFFVRECLRSEASFHPRFLCLRGTEISRFFRKSMFTKARSF
jgi:hypothetical protein